MNRGDLSWYVFVIVCDIAILHCVYGFESALVLGSVWFCCVVFGCLGVLFSLLLLFYGFASLVALCLSMALCVLILCL